MAFGGSEGLAAPSGVTPEFEHWFAQVTAEIEKALHEDDSTTITGDWTFSGSVTVEGTDGVDFNPGSDQDMDLLTVNVTGTPKIYWDESETKFATYGGGWFVNGSSIINNLSVVSQLSVTGGAPVVIDGTDGINFDPSGDQSVDLLTVDVTGSPVFGWDETYSAFRADANLAVTGDLSVTGTVYTTDTAVQGFFQFFHVNALVTASATQTQGQEQLTETVNIVTTCANANDVVTLPEAQTGLVVFIANRGAQTLQIYPASGDAINGGSADASITLSSGSKIFLVAYDSTDWEAY